MSLTDLLQKRVSTRAFLDKPVPEEIVNKIFAQAQLSPSNCNVQPWKIYVVSGAEKDRLKEQLMKAVMTGQEPNPDFDWTASYQGEHRDRQFGSANALYKSMAIDRDDKKSRMAAMLRNWTFFDAPHVVFFTMEKYLNIMGAVDMGIYAQTLTLLMVENGIASCLQGALGQFPEPVRELLDIPGEAGILFGMSFGYADEKAPVNSTRTERLSMKSSVSYKT